MKVLIACEESQRVCTEFRLRGHESYSCDILECSGGKPEWHIKGDVLPLLNGNCEFVTEIGEYHKIIGKWDLIIAHPPCTDLCVSGARHFERKREDGTQRKSIEFFCKFLEADCDKICIENPVGVISGFYVYEYFYDIAKKYDLPKKYDQSIHPYYFGDPFKKKTCLWLKGLPKLKPSNIVEPEEDFVYTNGKKFPGWMMDTLRNCKTKEERSKARSKTFPGIAKAMAEQWG